MKPKYKVATIIQARMKSSRLPGKALMTLNRKTVLWWMMKRASLADLVDEVILAIPYNDENDPIYKQKFWEQFEKGHVFRFSGSEDDVITRVLCTAVWFNVDIIVDLTADCPLVDPRHIDTLIKELLRSSCDYVSNDIIMRSWPDGLDIQVYWTSALKKCKDMFDPPSHVGWNIAKHPETFYVVTLKATPDMYWPELGLTLDTKEDYKLLQIIFEKFGNNPAFKVEDVVQYLRDNPELVEINKSVRRKTPEEG